MSEKIRIFISSVQREFERERKALAKYIREDALLGDFFEAFLFEEAPARSRSAQAVYLGEVEKCDVYLGLFGAKYGSRDAQGVSPTEREYDHATELNKTRLAFVKSVSRREKSEDAFVRGKIDTELSLIARAMSWTSYVEKSGSGTGVIIDKCTEHGLARPEFDPTSGFFKTIIWRNGSGTEGPGQGAQSRGRVGGPSQKGRVVAQSSGPVAAQSGPSRGPQSRGRVGGPSQRSRVKGAESGHMTRVERILQILAEPQCALGASQIARELNMNSVTGRLKKIFWLLLDDRIIERTELKPNSRLQKYRLTAKGQKLVASFKTKGDRK